MLLLFTAIFAAELGWAGISPLLPTYRDRYGLSDPATGLILTLASVGILVVSLPASALSNRFAVRSLTLWSIAALSAGNVVIGLSDSYGVLLAGRALYGVGLGIMWVTGTAWLHAAAGEDAPRALALTTSVVGAASLIGPAITGWLGEQLSTGAPFLILGGMTAVLLVVLLLARSPEGREVERNPPLREMLRAAGSDQLMVTSLILTLAVALMWMSAELLVPLRLDAEGFGASEIGLAFSVASIVFLVASAVTSARAERWATVRVSALWTAAFAGTVLVATVGTGVAPTIAFLAAVGLTTGVIVALTYPLGVAGAAQGGFSVAVVGSLLTIVWAGSGLVAPTLGGLAAEHLGDRLWFLALAAGGIAAAGWMWRRRSPRSSPTPASDLSRRASGSTGSGST